MGTAWRFAPTATDAERDALVWSIRGKPQGATFSVSTGVLSWTPGSTGTWSNIVITVTDARGAAASLPAFSIRVTAPEPDGSAALSWSPPTQYTDGSALPSAQLGSYRIYHGRSSSTLQRLAEVDSNTTTLDVRELDHGTHYFAVTAVTITGAESGLSAIGSKTIP